jgi:hypothetical protein
MKETSISLIINKSEISRNGQNEAIRFDLKEEHFGYTIEPFVFEGENKLKCNGCKFTIIPGAASDVAEVRKNVSIMETPVKGSGWLLAVEPNGLVNKYRFSNIQNTGISTSFELPFGSVSVWIADPQSVLEVVNVTEPPYHPEMEEFYVENDPNIPDKFWQEYWGLKQTVDTTDRRKYLNTARLMYETDGSTESYLTYLACDSDAKPMTFSDLAKILGVRWDRKSWLSQKELLQKCYDIFTKGQVGLFPGNNLERILITAVQVINIIDISKLKFR